MTTATVIPVLASVRDLLTDLLSCSTKVVDGTPQSLAAERPSLLAVYRRDDGSPAAAIVSDQDFALRAGAAIGSVSLDEVAPHDPMVGPQEDVLEGFHEVANVLARLLNGPTSPHVVLGELLRIPGELPHEVAALVLQPGQRCDYRVNLAGYGDGRITLLAG